MTHPPADLAGFTLEVREPEPVLVVAGELDLANKDEFLDQMRGLVAAAHSPAVVDLSAVSFLGSSASSALVKVNHEANERGVTLVLAAPSPFVRKVLDLTELSTVFELRD